MIPTGVHSPPHVSPLMPHTHTHTHCARENSTNGLRTPGPAAAGPLPPAGRPKEPALAAAGHPAAAEGRGRPDGLHHGLADPEEGPEGGGAPGVAGARHVPRSLQVRWRSVLCHFPAPALSPSCWARARRVCGTCLRVFKHRGSMFRLRRWRLMRCRFVGTVNRYIQVST